MKSVITVVLVAAVIGCSSFVPQTATLPKGAVACRTDYDCKSYGMVCSFQGVDQYASCKYTGPRE